MHRIKPPINALYGSMYQQYCVGKEVHKPHSSSTSNTAEWKTSQTGKRDVDVPASTFRQRPFSALLLYLTTREKKKRSRISYDQVFNYTIFFAMLTSMVSFYSEFDKYIKAMEIEKENESMQVKILEEILDGESGERIPWPLIHRQITQIREGKQPIRSLHSLYQHCKVYYPDDWLLLVEIGHILKDHTNQSLMSRGQIKDPIGFRHEILRHLIYLKHGKRPNLMENLHGNRVMHEQQNMVDEISPENVTERMPDEVKPILSAIIADVQKSAMPSDGFVV